MKCKLCGSENNELVKHHISNGSWRVYRYCHACKRNAIKPGYAFKLDTPTIKAVFDTLPILKDDTVTAPPCVVCGSRTGTEYHHFAPRFLFGIDCERWPGAMLCLNCHLLWHKLVTPGMYK